MTTITNKTRPSDVQYSLKILRRVSEVLLVGRTANNLSTLIPNELLKRESVNKIITDLVDKLKEVTQTTTNDERMNLHFSAIDKVEALVLGLLDTLRVHFPENLYPDFVKIFYVCVKWYLLALEDRLEEYYKYQSCYLFSKVLKQDEFITELPVRPTWLTDIDGYLLGGSFYRYFRLRSRSGYVLTNDDIGAFYALTNVKRAGLPISEAKQVQSLEKHKKNMMGAEYKPYDLKYRTYKKLEKSVDHIYAKKEEKTEIHDKEYISKEKNLTPDKILDLIKVRLEDLMNLIYSDCSESAIKYKVPSISAVYEGSSSKGGAGGKLDQILGGISDRVTDPFFTPIFVGFPNPRLMKRWCDPSRFPIYAEVFPEEIMLDMLKEFDKNYRGRPVKAQVHKVLEPFKCRVITAGEAIPYQLGRCLQTRMHRQLYEWSYSGFHLFKLIGSPIDTEYIQSMYEDRTLMNNEFYCAGDYSAATDGMHPDLHRHFTKYYCILKGLSPIWYDVMSSCLEGHEIHYKENIGGEVVESVINQSHGQLMGSPVSFPILCLVNAAVNWVSCDLYQGVKTDLDWWVRYHRPIFNGDDTSFISDPDHYRIWKCVAASAGYNISVGKSYCHPKMVMVNSAAFYVKEKNTFERIFVLNPGLLKGQSKVQSDDRKIDGAFVSEESYTSLSSKVDQLKVLLQDCPEDKIKLVKDIFVSINIQDLQKCSRPWSLPRHFGGLGLDGIGHPTVNNLLLCKLAKRDPELWSQLNATSKTKPSYSAREACAIEEMKQKWTSFYPQYKTEKRTRCIYDVEMFVDENYSLSKYFWGFNLIESSENNYERIINSNYKKMIVLKPWSEQKTAVEMKKVYAPEQVHFLPITL